MDSDEFGTIAIAVSPEGMVRARFEMKAYADGSGYDTVRSEIWDPKTRSWIPLTPGNIGEALQGLGGI